MEQRLLIIGAGVYSLVAKEIAESMHCFAAIELLDDHASTTPSGIPVHGTTADLEALSKQYTHAIVAIGNPEVRGRMLAELKERGLLQIATLVSPRAYVSPDAKISEGCILEPMAVVHTGCVLERGCIVSAGAVINHASLCEECVHVDCNATVAGYTRVPRAVKVSSGTVFSGERTDPQALYRLIRASR